MFYVLNELGPGQALTLSDVMDPAFTLGDAMVTDQYGNVYPPDSNSFAWGFEVCLWHHARHKHIEPVFEDESQRKAWEDHLGHQYLPPRPEADVHRPLWDVPFRLVEGVDPDQVEHVRSIGG